MILCDSHTHSNYSFDAVQTVEELCRTSVNAGMRRIALTDHYDIDCILDGFYDDYDAAAARAEVERCRPLFEGELDIIFGIEIGQPHLREKEAQDFIKRHGVEFVISSIHNLDRVPDYIFLNYETVPQPLIDDLYRRYVEELCLAASFEGAHTLAHVTYPARYINRDGREIDLSKFYDLYKKLFATVIDRGIALEINTSGIRKGYGMSPTEDILRLYRQCGGDLVSVGSDAHIPGEVGKNVADCIELARTIGFRQLLVPARSAPEILLIK